MTLSALDMTAIGAMSAFCEVSVLQPTVAIKNALQEGRAVSFHPRALYRGYLMNAGSIMPITAMAMGSQAVYTTLVEKVTGEKSGPIAGIGIAAAAGFTSCVVAAPTETIVVQQQRQAAKIAPTINYIWSNFGSKGFFRGTVLTGQREALYAAGYLGLYPPLKAWMNEQPVFGGSEFATTIGAAMIAGSAGALSSHPFDTVKTRMQAFLCKNERPEYSSNARAYNATMADGGAATLFKGAAPRTARIIMACIILNVTRGVFVDALEKFRGNTVSPAEEAAAVAAEGAAPEDTPTESTPTAPVAEATLRSGAKAPL